MLSVFKNISSFLAIIILALLPLSLVWLFLNLIGLDVSAKTGFNYLPFAGMLAIWGIAGGCISWLVSKIFARYIMKVRIINHGEKDPMLAKVLRIVEDTAKKAKLEAVPQTGYYVSKEINAFASGPTKSNALIAVSTGLLNVMNDAQLEGVIGHEIAHIKEGDMVTMTVMQGAANAIILFFSYALSFIMELRFLFKSESSQLRIHLFEVSFGIFGMMTVNSFSRRREFRADEGSAKIYGKGKIISALKVLQNNSGKADFDQYTSLAPFKISGNTTAFRRLLATHPPIEERIKRLENLPENAKPETEIKPEIADNPEQTKNLPQTPAVPANDSEKISDDIQTEKAAENKKDNPQGAANNQKVTKSAASKTSEKTKD